MDASKMLPGSLLFGKRGYEPLIASLTFFQALGPFEKDIWATSDTSV